jgi:hypothetical protein
MTSERARGPWAFGLLLLGCVASSLGCQSIADIPDVSYSPLCKQYCEAMFDVCVGPTREQYDDPRTCLEVCTTIDKAAKGSTLSKRANTVQCRLGYLNAASSSDSVQDAEEFCSYAGPGGGSVCTSQTDAPDCESYCALFDQACGSKIENLYAGSPDTISFGIDDIGSQAECVAKCRAIPRIGGYNWQQGKDSGNSLSCRLFHATKALGDPAHACLSAGIRSAGACQTSDHKPTCDDFCLTLTTACTGELKVYESNDQCLGVCAELNVGSTDTPDFVNTVGCRNSHAYNALLVSAKDHCPHSGPLGAQVCAANGACDAYCGLAKAACEVEFSAHFEDHEDCIEKCLEVEGGTGAAAATYSVAQARNGGNTVQCRALEVSRALDATDSDRADHCPAVFGEASPCVAD